jgi:hypothetical protein
VYFTQANGGEMLSTYLKNEIRKARKWGMKWSHIQDKADHYRQVVALGLNDIDPVYGGETVIHVGANEALIAFITKWFQSEAKLLASMGWDNIYIAVTNTEIYSSDDIREEMDCWEVEEAPYNNGEDSELPHWRVAHNGRYYAVKAEMFSHRITETSKSARAAQMQHWGIVYTTQYIGLMNRDVTSLHWHIEVRYNNCVVATGFYDSIPQSDVYYMQPFVGEAWQLDPYEFIYQALQQLYWSWEDKITEYLRKNNISGAQIFMETPEVYWPHIGEE